MTTNRDHLLSNKLYDWLKILALIVFPAIGVLYTSLAAIWGLPAAENVAQTILAIDTFLGVLIKIGDYSYNASESKYDGDINVVKQDDGRKTFELQLNTDPQTLDLMDEVRFKVLPPAK